MRVTNKVPEHVFTWPLGNSLPDEEKIRVVCQVPMAADLMKAQRSASEPVTNELTGTTRIEFHWDNVNAVYNLCVLRVENAQAEDGTPIKPSTAKGNLYHYMRSNFGLDEDVHGCFQIEFVEWFNKKIMRVREESKKNVTPSPQPATDSTPNPEIGLTPPTNKESPSTPVPTS